MLSAEERSERAQVAAIRRHHKGKPEAESRYADYKADRLAIYIRKVVESAPPLNAEQRTKLAVLLLDGRRAA